MFRVLITDANYKHAVALAAYARSVLADVYFIGHCNQSDRPARWTGSYDELVHHIGLTQALEAIKPDMVMPVGATSVVEVMSVAPTLAVLPSQQSIEIAFNKALTMRMAQENGIPIPRTHYVTDPSEVPSGLSYPCVVKAALENAPGKSTLYCRDDEELRAILARHLPRQKDGLLVQEYIEGVGHGLFALMDKGVARRVFMHQRLRENPPSGGVSTAAKAFESERLRQLGLSLLEALQWNGVAMVEFRRRNSDGEYFLMEINGKFWGSAELSLAAGVNFGADLIRLYRGESLGPDTGFDTQCEFYWPLDGDILTLVKTRRISSIRDYWRPNAHTNLGRSLKMDVWKCLKLVRDLSAI